MLVDFCKNNKLIINLQAFCVKCDSFLVFLHIMKIIMIGAGNLATNLAAALLGAGHDILQVYSRTMQSAQALAIIAGAAAVADIGEVRSDADLYILSVKDDALPLLIPQLCRGKEDKLFLHTAGSVSMDVFQGMAHHYGVFYPMQTFSKQKRVDFDDIPCFVEGSGEEETQAIEALAGELSRRVYQLSSADRKYLHLSAVFACNFVNHCYAVSEQILAKHGIPFDVMLPLIDETAAKVHHLNPVTAQTGPAVRFDETVIRNQSQLLRDNPLLKDIYERMSMSIHRFSEDSTK